MYPIQKDKKSVEQKLIKTVRALDYRRTMQVLDFARWLQTQPAPSEIEEDETWEAAYMQNKDEFRAMARQALQDLNEGETLELTLENDHIRPR